MLLDNTNILRQNTYYFRKEKRNRIRRSMNGAVPKKAGNLLVSPARLFPPLRICRPKTQRPAEHHRTKSPDAH